MVTRDVPPYVMAVGTSRGSAQHQRRGPEAARLHARSRSATSATPTASCIARASSSQEALERLERAAESEAEIRLFVEFIRSSSRSLVR